MKHNKQTLKLRPRSHALKFLKVIVRSKLHPQGRLQDRRIFIYWKVICIEKKISRFSKKYTRKQSKLISVCLQALNWASCRKDTGNFRLFAYDLYTQDLDIVAVVSESVSAKTTSRFYHLSM